MAHFVNNLPVRVTIPEFPDEWVEVKKKLSFGDRNKVQGALVQLNQDQKMSVDVGRFYTLILELSIINWRLFERDDDGEIVKNGDGEPKLIPFRRDLIENFDPDDPLVDKCLEMVGELNPTLSNQKVTTST